MDKEVVARMVLAAVGGAQNVLTNTVCMTRLRITLADPKRVNFEELNNVHSVLGTSVRGSNGLEIVFGPRMIEDIFTAFIALTGKDAGSDALFPMSRRGTKMHVQIITKRASNSSGPSANEESFLNDSDISRLEDIFGKRDPSNESDLTELEHSNWRLLVINGPNVNMLGLGASSDDDEDDFPALLELCKQTATEVGFARCDCFQSNHEGDLVDKIQDALLVYDGIVINPSVYGTSAALRDALRSVAIPAVEVHLRTQRTLDEVGAACIDTKSGLGIDGYRKAIIALAQHLNRL